MEAIDIAINTYRNLVKGWHFIGWLILAMASGAIARRRGRSDMAWFLLAMFLGPLALILLLLLPVIRKVKAQSTPVTLNR